MAIGMNTEDILHMLLGHGATVKEGHKRRGIGPAFDDKGNRGSVS